jgi:hypothetical protein
MAIRWAESGANYHESIAIPTGIYGNGAAVALATNTPLYNGSTYGQEGNGTAYSPAVGAGAGGYTGGIFGFRYNTASSLSVAPLVAFVDANQAVQCDLRINASGQLYFTRNGTNLGSGNPTLSTNTLSTNGWYYIEFKALLSTSATGTCEVRVNGNVWLTLTSVQNATTTNLWYGTRWTTAVGGQYYTDMVLLDTSSGVGNVNYLGDVTVGEYYASGAGVNSAWSNQGGVTAAALGPFTVTATAAPSGGTQVYTINSTNNPPSTANALQGYYFVITGMSNGANNGTFYCSASTSTSLTLSNASGVSSSSQTGSAAFQAITQIGIYGGPVAGFNTTNVGTRPNYAVSTSPNADTAYLASNTVGQQNDNAHQALTLTGTIYGVIHRTYAKKDDAGARAIAQQCLSGATTETGATINLGSSYSYYDDILENDPNTSAAWTVPNFNNATFGVKLIS